MPAKFKLALSLAQVSHRLFVIMIVLMIILMIVLLEGLTDKQIEIGMMDRQTD